MSAPLYRKVDPRVWDDDKFIELSDDAQLLWLLVLTGPQTTIVPGLMTGGLGTLSEVLRKGSERVSKAFEELLEKGLIEHDPKRRVLRVPNAPRYNEPANPNVLRGWFRAWRSAPESPLKYAHIGSLEAAIDQSSPHMARAWEETFGTIPQTLREGLPEPSPKPFPKQDQEQKQEQEQEQDQKTLSNIASDDSTPPDEPSPLELVSPEIDPDRLTPERLVALWNEATDGRIREITPERRRSLARAIKLESRIDWWRRCFAKAAEIKRTPDSGWLTLDWIVAHGRKGWNAERVAGGGFDFRLTQNKRDITTGYAAYGPEQDAKWKEAPSGDITHLL